jgi:L-ribulose-5-phosphate 3-epimerase
MDAVSRRRFVRTAAVAGALAAVSPRSLFAQQPRTAPPLCFFSKPLPQMDARRLGRALKSLGFSGVDLTVRPGGHVDPARVAADLPPFVATLRQEGVDVPMITTALVAESDPAARPTLETAARLNIRYYKPGYYQYQFIDLRKELDAAGQQLRGLAGLSAQIGIQLGYHNHAGNVGGSIWDIAATIDSLDAASAGYYFDVRHAVVEGGDGGWRTAFLRAAPRLKMIALKDFFWEKTASGWRQRHCPMGEGMVDWKTFFAMLAKSGFRGPASLHIEYEIPGATAAAREERTLAAAARDLAFVNTRIAEAYSEAAARGL